MRRSLSKVDLPMPPVGSGVNRAQSAICDRIRKHDGLHSLLWQLEEASLSARLPMPWGAANDLQPHASPSANAGEGMAKIMNANIFQPGLFANASPCLGQADVVAFASHGREHLIGTFLPRQVCKYLQCGCAQHHNLLPGFGIFQPQTTKAKIYFTPL